MQLCEANSWCRRSVELKAGSTGTARAPGWVVLDRPYYLRER